MDTKYGTNDAIDLANRSNKNTNMKILVVEDEDSIRSVLRSYLKNHEFDVMDSGMGNEGLKLALDNEFDCILMDIDLPDTTGLEVLKNLREHGNETPLIFLTGTKKVDVKVEGFEYGADDYVTKPFDFKELVARIKTIARRKKQVEKAERKEVLVCGSLKLDLLNREFKIKDKLIFLTNNEFNLLAYFLKHKNEVVSRQELSENVWHIYFDTQTNFVNVYISYLRKKMRAELDEDLIETIRGEGFRLNCPG